MKLPHPWNSWQDSLLKLLNDRLRVFCIVSLPSLLWSFWNLLHPDCLRNSFCTQPQIYTLASGIILITAGTVVKRNSLPKYWLLLTIFFSVPFLPLPDVEEAMLATAGVTFFLFFRQSKNGIIREISLFFLAFAIARGDYPAIFALLLIFDREYRAIPRLIIYSVLLYLLVPGVEPLAPPISELWKPSSLGLLVLALCSIVLAWREQIYWRRILFLCCALAFSPCNRSVFLSLCLVPVIVLFFNKSKALTSDWLYLAFFLLQTIPVVIPNRPQLLAFGWISVFFELTLFAIFRISQKNFPPANTDSGNGATDAADSQERSAKPAKRGNRRNVKSSAAK